MRDFIESVKAGAGFTVGVVCVLAAMKIINSAFLYMVLQLTYSALPQ
jgi:hypothetical protein